MQITWEAVFPFQHVFEASQLAGYVTGGIREENQLWLGGEMLSFQNHNEVNSSFVVTS